MKEKELLDALSQINPKMIGESEPGTHKKKITARAWIAGGVAAAILLCAIPVSLLARKPKARANPWDRDDFRMITVGFSSPASVPVTQTSFGKKSAVLPRFTSEMTVPEVTEGEPVPETEEEYVAQSITVPINADVKIESLIADRYLLWYEDKLTPVFYDLQTKKTFDFSSLIVDPDQRTGPVFFDDVLSLVDRFDLTISEVPSQIPAFRDYAHAFLLAYVEGTPLPENGDSLDFSRTSGDVAGYYHTNEEKLAAFEEALKGRCDQLLYEYEEGTYRPVVVQIFCVDALRGRVFYHAHNHGYSSLVQQDISDYDSRFGTHMYDLSTGEITDLPEEFTSRAIASLGLGLDIASFTPDGGRLLFVSPSGNGGGHYDDMTGWSDADMDMSLYRYKGEIVRYLDFESGASFLLGDSTCGRETEVYASSMPELSPTGRYVYYRAYTDGEKFFGFYREDMLGRLDALHFRDTDSWCFVGVKEASERERGKNVFLLLTGNFVRFVRNDTAVVMEKDGKTHVYSLVKGGKEITDSVESGKVLLDAHEYYRLVFEGGVLYRVPLFDGSEKEAILRADTVCLSDDGAFAFGYEKGADHAVCVNVATLESRNIRLDPAFVRELSEAGKVGFSFTYDEENNVLFLSFYRQSEEEQTDFDLFDELLDPVFDADDRPLDVVPMIGKKKKSAAE